MEVAGIPEVKPELRFKKIEGFGGGSSNASGDEECTE
jgi:hypothetical protein